MTRKLPSITIKELIESGAHFGHRTMRWNPKMSSYLFGKNDFNPYNFFNFAPWNRKELLVLNCDSFQILYYW